MYLVGPNPVLRIGLLAAWVGACSLVAPRPAAGQVDAPGSQRAMLLVHAVDSESERSAGRIFGALREQLVQGRSFEYVEIEDLLRGGAEPGTGRDEARELFERGRKEYDNLELDRAIEQFTKALRVLQSNPHEPLDRQLTTDVLIYLGAAQILSEDVERGRRAFERLVAFNPLAGLDPMVFPPTLAQEFERAKAQTPGQGALEVHTTPPGAEIWVDGQLTNISPATLQGLPAGEHWLRLVRREHQPHGAKVKVRSGATLQVKRALDPLPGTGRLQALLGRLNPVAERERYPKVVDELLAWAKADRLFFLRVEQAGPRVQISGFCYDGVASQRLQARRRSFDPGADDFTGQAGRFFAALAAADSAALAQTDADEDLQGQAGVELSDSPPSEPGPDGLGSGDDAPLWKRWWLWTVVAVVVAGGTGLALGLTLGGGSGADAGDVVFRF